jgi:tol-pal system-associated acyl-CoA thioesterase
MYHGAYVDFFARARNEWAREQGLDISRQATFKVCFIVHHLCATYHKPAKLDDWLEVSTEIESISRIKITFQQKIYRGTELLAEAQVTVIAVDSDSLNVKRLPIHLFEEIS